MNEQKNLLIVLGEWWQQRQVNRREYRGGHWNGWLPSRGNVLFTLVMIAVLLWAQSAGAVSQFATRNSQLAASTGTIAYQGRLADSSGNPLTQTLNMSFRLYAGASGGAPLWTEQWTGSNGVQVSDGLFNVMLGSLTPIPPSVITGNSTLFLGITVGTDDEMSPRVQLGSVPFAVQALTVPDGSITKAKLAGDVSLVPPDGSVTTAKIADGAVTLPKLNLNGDLSVTGTIRADEIRTTLYSKEGTSSVQFSNSNAWSTVPDLTATFTLTHATNVLAYYHINMGANGPVNDNSHIVTRLVIDDVEARSSRSLVGNTTYWSPASLWMGSLGSGVHIIKVQYRTPNGGQNIPSSDWSGRSLQVLVFGN